MKYKSEQEVQQIIIIADLARRMIKPVRSSQKCNGMCYLKGSHLLAAADFADSVRWSEISSFGNQRRQVAVPCHRLAALSRINRLLRLSGKMPSDIRCSTGVWLSAENSLRNTGRNSVLTLFHVLYLFNDDYICLSSIGSLILYAK